MNEYNLEGETATLGRRFSGRVCIVTGELAGPDFNGGIGTTNRTLALALRDLGFSIDILYTQVSDGQPFSARGAFAQHVSAYQKLGIRLLCINNTGKWNDWLAKSYHSMQHLAREGYDLAFFDDTHGNAYYSLMARRTGSLLFENTTICVTAHSATQWISDLNQTPIATFEELRLMEIERRCIELADAIKAPSAYILEKYRSYGWSVPDNSIVLPNFISGDQPSSTPQRKVAIKELVFFGRLETRKGLWMFCRAMDRLKYHLADNITVTFLGKTTYEDGISTADAVVHCSAAWPFKTRLLTNFDRGQALAYLKGDGRLAIMPSPEDNSPSVLLECLIENIPFIACSGSGGEELLDEQSRLQNLFPPSVDDLCSKIIEVLQSGASTARASFSQVELETAFEGWVSRLLHPPRHNASKLASPAMPTRPILIIIVPADFSPQRTVVELRAIVNEYQGQIEIEVLTANVDDLHAALLRDIDHLPIAITHINEFEKIALSLKYRPSTVVGLCHITQTLPSSWIDRAHRCFGLNSNISAITGMVSLDSESIPLRHESFVSSSDNTTNIHRYLLGNASALFLLQQETNSGFCIMRSEILPSLSNLAPFDIQYARPKRMEDWVHEILLTLHSQGGRFELIPDQTIKQSVHETGFESFRLSHILRSLSQSLSRHTLATDFIGSDLDMLTRLAIDTGLRQERHRANLAYLRSISNRIGREMGSHDMSFRDSDKPDAAHLGRLAKLAHAGGQLQLAVDLCAKIVADETASKTEDWVGFIKSAADAVKLIDLMIINRYETLNISDDFMLRVTPDMQQIEIHSNASNKGIAAVVFPSVDLKNINHFVSNIEVPDSSHAIRFRIELSTADRALHWSNDKVIQGGSQAQWQIECPEKMRTLCRVIIGAEMADPEAVSNNAFSKWINPRFIRRV